MQYPAHAFLLAACLAVAPSIHAQAPPDPSGHWEGLIEWEGNGTVPPGKAQLQFDLVKGADSRIAGEITIPDYGLKSRPLANIATSGRDVSFQIALSASRDNMFMGTIANDGTTMSGNFNYQGTPLPFHATRKGAAVLAALTPSTPIAKEIEGEWNGTLEAGGKTIHLVLTLANQAGGTSTGKMISLDQNNLEIPITTITQKEGRLVLVVNAVGGTFASSPLNGATEINGVWTQGVLTAPLVFRRPSKP